MNLVNGKIDVKIIIAQIDAYYNVTSIKSPKIKIFICCLHDSHTI